MRPDKPFIIWDWRMTDIKKFFTPNKLFFGFCILFVLEFLGLQLVSYLHITDQAKLDGQRIFNWTWSSKNIRSFAKIDQANILSRNNNTATVKVSGKEYIYHVDENSQAKLTAVADDIGSDIEEKMVTERMSKQPAGQSEITAAPCAAHLTYYRMNNKWFLGVVELE
jgi:hypothetical protein